MPGRAAKHARDEPATTTYGGTVWPYSTVPSTDVQQPMRAERIIISRTDHIGDVVLTLPMVGILRRYHPSSEILLLGSSYTKAAIDACEHIDGFMARDEVAESDRKVQAAFLEDREADAIIHVYPRRDIAAAARADALVCASTGPVHLAAALGKCAIGIQPPVGIGRPASYGPVGKNSHAVVYDPNCEKCWNGLDCDCLQEIPISATREILDPLADEIVGSERRAEG